MKDNEKTPMYAVREGTVQRYSGVEHVSTKYVGDVVKLGMTLEDCRGAAWGAAEDLEQLADRVEKAWRDRDGDYLRSRDVAAQIVICVSMLYIMGELLGEYWDIEMSGRYAALDAYMGDD